jgi:hypothetical protein
MKMKKVFVMWFLLAVSFIELHAQQRICRGVSPGAIQVVTGITCKNETGNGNTFNVSEIILHSTLDVALLKLSTNLSYNNNRQAINYVSSTNSTY